MPPYQEPKYGETLDAKFIRIQRSIFVGVDPYANHPDIVELDHLEGSIARLRGEKPDEVDAGWVGVSTTKDILANGYSEELDLPVLGHAKKAREITLRVLAEQSPGHNVFGFRR